MIVLDASVAVRLLDDESQLSEHVEIIVAASGGRIHVPSHFKAEVLSAMRGLYLSGRFTRSEFIGRGGVVDQFPVFSHDIEPLITRVLALADNATVHDAAYLALAEVLDCPLVTADKKLADIPGSRAKVLLV
jgi:predicted nucleic acid-binding protein